MKRATEGAVVQSAEVRRIIKELQDTTAQRYLVVRASRYENLLRAAPANYSGARSYLLAFTDELVVHRRTAPAPRASASLPVALPSTGSSCSRAPIRLGYKDIAEVKADGSRLIIQLHSTDRSCSLEIPSSSQPPPSPLRASAPSTIQLQSSTRDSADHSSSLGLLLKWLDQSWRRVTGLFRSSTDLPSSTPRAGPPPINRGRRMSRAGAESLFGLFGSEAAAPNMLVVEMESSQACAQMQVSLI